MHTAGAVQVFAGPSSGKTYVTVHRIKQLITGSGVDPSRILVITFTKAAALEMQERFFRLTKPDRPPVRFGTFHAVFYHILKQSSQYRGYTIITESEKRKLIRRIIHMHQRFACLQEEDIDSLIEAVSACKRSSVLKTPVQKTDSGDILFLVKEYETYLMEFHQMDFDDIIKNCRKLLCEDPSCLALWQGQFQFVMIDEFQDISPDQYEIIRLLAAPEHNLFVVGDDDQSIYGFRGASPDSMQAFQRDYPQAERIFLNINYRCHRQIVEASLKVIEENHNRAVKQICGAHEAGTGFHLQIFENKAGQQEKLVRALKEKQQTGRISQCAMICRTNFDCAIWAQYMHKNKIPFFMKEAPKNRFSHFVIRDIMAYLALAQGELLRKHFLRIMNRPVRYLKRDSVPEEQISESGLLAYYRGSPALADNIRKLFRELHSLSSRKLHLQIHYIRKVIGYESYLKEKYKAREAEEMIRTAAEFQELAEQFATFADLSDYIAQYEETLEEIRREKQKTGIRLMTMHASKGLEFDTVYMPDCQEGKIPSAKALTTEEIEEERRMFYVAMTRAKRDLYLMADKGRTGKDAPSRFLQCLCQSSSPTSSSNSAESRYSSKASATASYSSSSSM